ncbi:hypothetical protein GCM10009760_62960 [Kitasatospora kazusensis]|uniref:Uncharacterized protein n=1 Tax=Kitasatospora kazusensis TaxID=407974 RepID=A0ABN1ZLM4_9ACTN
MDPVTGSVVVAILGLGGGVVSLLGQSLQLRWRARQAEAERQLALALTARCCGLSTPGASQPQAQSQGSSDEHE